MTVIRPAIRDELLGAGQHPLAGLARPGGLRAAIRLGGIAAWTAVLFVVLVSGMWVTAAPRRRLSWRNRIVSLWARGLGRIVRMKVRVSGPRPPAPFFLVANHLSYVDIVLLLGQVDGVFIAKRELGHWPILGYLTRLVGTIFVDRASPRDAKRVLDAIDQRFRSGDGVIVFPEGTSSDGSDVSPMKAALFEWAAQTGNPIHVVTIQYATAAGLPAAREVVCWWGPMSFVPHAVDLCRLPGFEATLHFGSEPIQGADRARLAGMAREAILANFVSQENAGSRS